MRKKVDEKVKFLDPKRSQSISIIASSIKRCSPATGSTRPQHQHADPEVVERLMTLCPIAKSELVSCRDAASLDNNGDLMQAGLINLIARSDTSSSSARSRAEGQLRCLHLQQHLMRSTHCEPHGGRDHCVHGGARVHLVASAFAVHPFCWELSQLWHTCFSPEECSWSKARLSLSYKRLLQVTR